MQRGVLFGVLSKRLKDRMVEEEAEYCKRIANRDVVRQGMHACTEWLLNMHRLVVRQRPGLRGHVLAALEG